MPSCTALLSRMPNAERESQEFQPHHVPYFPQFCTMVNLPQQGVTFWKAAKPYWPMHYQRLRATAREDGAVSITLELSKAA